MSTVRPGMSTTKCYEYSVSRNVYNKVLWVQCVQECLQQSAVYGLFPCIKVCREIFGVQTLKPADTNKHFVPKNCHRPHLLGLHVVERHHLFLSLSIWHSINLNYWEICETEINSLGLYCNMAYILVLWLDNNSSLLKFCCWRKVVKTTKLTNTTIMIHSFIHSLTCTECDDCLPFSAASSIPLCCALFTSTQFYHVVFILPYFVFPSISRSTSQAFFSKFILNTFWGILFPSTLCTCPNQHNLFSLIVSATAGFLTIT